MDGLTIAWIGHLSKNKLLTKALEYVMTVYDSVVSTNSSSLIKNGLKKESYYEEILYIHAILPVDNDCSCTGS